jgi:hypothetical protein
MTPAEMDELADEDMAAMVRVIEREAAARQKG